MGICRICLCRICLLEAVIPRQPPMPNFADIQKRLAYMAGVDAVAGPKPHIPAVEEQLLQFMNSADKESLLRVKGIGIARAATIITSRENGPFKSLDSLQEVTKIPKKQVEFMIKNFHLFG